MKSEDPVLRSIKQKIFSRLGQNIKLARQHRKLSLQRVAERANISRPTLWKIEKGSSSVSIGSYFYVLFVLDLEKDLAKVAGNDILYQKHKGTK